MRFYSGEVSEGIAAGLVQKMASRRKRGLTEDEILQLVFDSDAESDICDDEDVSLDDGEYQSDESSSDEEENVCAAEDPMDTSPPSPKTRKMEEWQWEEDDSVEKIVKHSFSGQPGIKRSIELHRWKSHCSWNVQCASWSGDLEHHRVAHKRLRTRKAAFAS